MSNRWQYQPKAEGWTPETLPVPFIQDTLPRRAIQAVAPLAVASAFIFTPAPEPTPEIVSQEPQIPAVVRPWTPVYDAQVLSTDTEPDLSWASETTVVFPPKRIQPPSLAEPIFFEAPAAPFSELVNVQGSDVFQRLRRPEGAFVLGDVPRTQFNWGTGAELVIPAKTVLYQARVEPIVVQAPAAFTELVNLPPSDLFQIPPRPDGLWVMGLPAFQRLDWIEPFPGPSRREAQRPPQDLAQSLFFAPAAPAFSELVSLPQPDAFRRPIRPQGMWAIGLPRLQTLDWLEQPPGPGRLPIIRLGWITKDPVTPPAVAAPDIIPIQVGDIVRRRIRPEGFFAIGLPRLQTLNWLEQSPDPIRVKRVLDTRTAFVFAPAPAQEFFLEWFAQGQEPRRRIGRPEGGESFVTLVVPNDWRSQLPDLSRIRSSVRDNRTVFLFVPAPIDWLSQKPDPKLLKIRRPSGDLVLPALVRAPTDWRPSFPEFARRKLIPIPVIPTYSFDPFPIPPPPAPDFFSMDRNIFPGVRPPRHPGFYAFVDIEPFGPGSVGIVLYVESGIAVLDVETGTGRLYTEAGIVDLDVESAALILRMEDGGDNLHVL